MSRPAPARRTKTHRPPTDGRRPPTAGDGFLRARTESYSKRSDSPAPAKRSGASKKSTVRKPPSPVLHEGSVVDGKWLLMRPLGAGGMGAVWEAVHVINGHRAALKVMSPMLAADRRYRDEFAREGAVDNLVNREARVPVAPGPGTTEVYDTGTVDGTSTGAPYMVMDALEGRSLGSILDTMPERKIPAHVVAEILDNALFTLEAAHRSNIVHRDLKPDNMWLTPDGNMKVLDFGLAKVGPGKSGNEPLHFIGTSGYAPPEQTVGLADPRSDLYSMGVAGYEMLTGRLPSKTPDPDSGRRYLLDLKSADPESFEELAANRLEAGDFTFEGYPGCPVPSVRDAAPHVSPELASVIDKALACDPADRYASAKAMREDLELALKAEMLRRA